MYLGLALFLVLTVSTVVVVHRAWQRAAAHNRAEAVFDLVQVRTPMRPTDKPGAIAWLDREIRRQEQARAASTETADAPLGSVAADPGPVPTQLMPMVEAAAQALVGLEPSTRLALRYLLDEQVRPAAVEPAVDRLQFRSQRFLAYDPSGAAPDTEVTSPTAGDWLVVTRRRSFDDPGDGGAEASDRFLRWAAPYLVDVRDRLASLPPRTQSSTPRIIRVYAVAEDGTFVSVPWLPRDASLGSRRAITWQEGVEFRKKPRLPNFVPNEFFYRFDFTRLAGQSHHSGLYLDLGGHGLVTTVTVPVASPDRTFLAVLAIDLTLDIDWQRFAASVPAPLVTHVTALDAPSPGGWQPWSRLQGALDAQRDRGEAVPAGLERLLGRLAARERRSGTVVNTAPEHHLVEPGIGALAVFQVARRDWLLVFFPELASPFPVQAVALLGLMLVLLLAGFERNRRRAEAAQIEAEHELRERQNLLEALRVPIAVVDPNSDQVVSGNEAAAAIGLVPGSCIGDLVAGDAARAHYDRMQQTRGGPRRAYGVPIRVAAEEDVAVRDGEDSGEQRTRLALVRSVPVASPIASLGADERHRLGILFLVEPETDLPLYAGALERSVRDDERRRLAGLLSHGIDTLAHVLDARLRATGDDGDRFARWLAGYLSRRIRVTAWLLGRWYERPPLAAETTLEASQMAATLARFQSIFALVRDDPALRTRLHWANGVLASDGVVATGDDGVFDVRLDWPERFLLTLPIRGGAGLFLEEVLINAVRHGRPGSRPAVTMRFDPVRRELVCRVANRTVPGVRRAEADLEPYGGRRIVERLAELFGWTEFSAGRQGERFEVTWRMPVSERQASDEGD